MERYRVTTDNLDWLGIHKNFIVYKKDNNWVANRYIGYDEEIVINGSYLMDRCIETNSSWFQKIEEKTYEILGLGASVWDVGCIYKVRRLSDGEIFSVGDKIKYSSEVKTITGFEIFGTDCMMVKCGTALYSLDCIKHHKPILTTEDGKDIYNNDIVYGVSKYDGAHISQYNIKKKCSDGFRQTDNDHYWYFSTLSLAEKFVEENKPQFSKKDMIEFADYYQQEYIKPEGYFPAYKLEEWLKTKQNDKN